MLGLKKDHEEFTKIIQMLRNGEIKTGLGNQSRKWIPKYIYHFTDLNNAINIIEHGNLYSRNQAIKKGIMENDNASKEVMSNTKNKWKDYVRFYFRPKTPTQYRNEGVRSKNSLVYDAHCPIPVFFLFDSQKLLTRSDSYFSYGSLATGNETIYNTANDFGKMPFEKVFHEGPYDPYLQADIKFHKHAELIIPHKCELDHLHSIVCRSEAEKETLINSLSLHALATVEDKIKVDTRNKFFYGTWTYIESVTMTKEKIIFDIHKKTGDVFDVYLEVNEDKVYSLKKSEVDLNSRLTINFKNFNPESYSVNLFLDNNLVYSGVYIDDNSLPF